MADSKSITQARLRELFSYDPDTGLLTRRTSVWGHGPEDRVGTLDGAGYLSVGIDKKYYRAHRLIWLYVHGQWPKHHLDHINLDKTDNRLKNLREASRSQNHCNRRVQRNNTSGMKGVVPDNRSRKTDRPIRWQAYISMNGKRHYLGCFSSAEEAYAARVNAALLLHGEFAKETDH